LILVDSSGWIEYLADGPLASAFAPALQEPRDVLVPSIVVLAPRADRAAGRRWG